MCSALFGAREPLECGLGTLLGVRAGAAFPVSTRVSLRASLGIDLLLRFPVDLEAGAAARKDVRRLSLAYFYGKGRFLYPETSLFCKWRISERFGLAYLDQLVIGGGLGFTYSLR
jgi:hypothetical protein